MSAFLYTAVDTAGKRSKGLLDAASAAEARATLRARALLPISVEATRARAGAGAGARTSLFRHKLSLRRLTLVTRQLATLIGAQVRIDDALRIVADQQPKPRDASFLLNLRSAVQDGQSLADALDAEPASFNAAYRASVRAGERAGRLSEVMNQLADHIEAQARNRQSIQLALIYPALLAVVSIGVILALLGFVVPDIVRVFTARGADLPALTRALIATSDGLQRYGPALGAAVLASAVILGALMRRPAMRALWHRVLATGRLSRKLVQRVNAAQFTGTLAMLMQSGVPLADALRAAAGTVGNLYLRSRIATMTREIEDGASLSASARRASIFSPMLVAMIASGEAGGTLAASLDRAAADQSRELKAAVATMVALVEPGVLLVMGGIVMMLVLAILMPIMQLNSLAG
ncbi:MULTISPECIES: type II secretion system F family protein [unclassified Marinovum]